MHGPILFLWVTAIPGIGVDWSKPGVGVHFAFCILCVASDLFKHDMAKRCSIDNNIMHLFHLAFL